MRLSVKIINPTGQKHTASVIFFHGSGDTGSNLLEWVRFLLGGDMDFDHIKVIYPTAPLQPYTPMDGEKSNVWFDRRSINIAALESRKSLSQSYELVRELVDEELSRGIQINRIILGGFSMGGALALHAAFHLRTDLAGVFACSSFLNRDSIVYDSLRTKTTKDKLPELLMFHGERDTLVPLEWGKETFDELKQHGIKGTFTPLANTLHELKRKELLDLQKWILLKLPANESNIPHKL